MSITILQIIFKYKAMFAKHLNQKILRHKIGALGLFWETHVLGKVWYKTKYYCL